ncbi:hypothetical protein PGTUg99_009653 [Puccinia graminis f. sp. tritici]|nr:hypothetical protein PGTUg99_009653 [Puccinia graminis f. sp. tritici]
MTLLSNSQEALSGLLVPRTVLSTIIDRPQPGDGSNQDRTEGTLSSLVSSCQVLRSAASDESKYEIEYVATNKLEGPSLSFASFQRSRPTAKSGSWPLELNRQMRDFMLTPVAKEERSRRKTVHFLIDLCCRFRRRKAFLDSPAAGPTQALLRAGSGQAGA